MFHRLAASGARAESLRAGAIVRGGAARPTRPPAGIGWDRSARTAPNPFNRETFIPFTIDDCAADQGQRHCVAAHLQRARAARRDARAPRHRPADRRTSTQLRRVHRRTGTAGSGSRGVPRPRVSTSTSSRWTASARRGRCSWPSRQDRSAPRAASRRPGSARALRRTDPCGPAAVAGCVRHCRCLDDRVTTSP